MEFGCAHLFLVVLRVFHGRRQDVQNEEEMGAGGCFSSRMVVGTGKPPHLDLSKFPVRPRNCRLVCFFFIPLTFFALVKENILHPSFSTAQGSSLRTKKNSEHCITPTFCTGLFSNNSSYYTFIIGTAQRNQQSGDIFTQ